MMLHRNRYKLFLKFHLKHVFIGSNFENKAYVTSVHSAKGRRICSIYEKGVPYSLAWETSVGHSCLLQQKLPESSVP